MIETNNGDGDGICNTAASNLYILLNIFFFPNHPPFIENKCPYVNLICCHLTGRKMADPRSSVTLCRRGLQAAREDRLRRKEAT